MGWAGLRQLVMNMRASVSTYNLVALPMYILLGQVMFKTGMAPRAIDAIDHWIGRLPGRLSLQAVAGGTLFATLSGSSMSGVALLGSLFAPEMERRGYKKAMVVGPIIAAGGLATMIPPSGLGVLLASVAQISVGKLLIGITLPGFMMAAFYAAYILVRCSLQRSLAPSYEVPAIPVSQKIVEFLRYVLPMGAIIFLVTGLIFVGLALPSESAAMGALGAFGLAAVYRKLSWKITKECFQGAARVTVMIFLIFAAATTFSQILAFTGATRGIVELAVSAPVAPILIIIATQVIVAILGCLMDVAAIMMITVPIYFPVVQALGFDPIWFAAILLLNIEMAGITPPFGMSLFVMKAVSPKTKMSDIYKAGTPFVIMNCVIMGLMMAFPPIVLWLTTLMRY